MIDAILLPGKRPFDLAHRVFNSKVEVVVDDLTSMEVSTLGTFDVMLFLGVLYHMDNLLGALRRLAQLTQHGAIIETHAVVVPGDESSEICDFYSSNR